MSDATTAVRPSLRDPATGRCSPPCWRLRHRPPAVDAAACAGPGRRLDHLAPAGSRRRAAEVNLQLCFPEKDEAWRQRLVRDSFDALGVGVFECIRAWWGSIDSIRPQVQIEDWNICGRCRRKVVACCWCPAIS
jgi:KDO2-lipid IV(A) lauroyltransferase